MLISEAKDNLSGMLHGGTLNKVRNIAGAFQRAANTMLAKIDPVDTIRVAPLANTIHDDVFNYPLASDYKKLIDLIPQNRRNSSDVAGRRLAESFDLKKGLTNKTVSIEGSEGSKIIRINWRSRTPKVINEANSVTENGTWSTVGSATGLVADDIDYISGSGSLRFNVIASSDGIQNTTMDVVDLTDEDEVGDFYFWIKLKDSTDVNRLTSVSLTWGNDLTTNYWTGVAQTTQADGSAFRVGWNQIKVPWSTATETGTVSPSTIDSLKITFARTGQITNIRVDNIVCSIGRNFDHKYYSKFLLKDTTGTWIGLTTSDDDEIVLDSDAIQIYLLETLIACAHQIEGADSSFDISWAKKELLGEDLRDQSGLYAKYRKEYPSMAVKAIGSYGTPTSLRHFR